MTLWEVNVQPRDPSADMEARRLRVEAANLELTSGLEVRTARGFLIEGTLAAEHIRRAVDELLADPVCECGSIHELPGEPPLPFPDFPLIVHVLLLPGVTDPVAESTLAALRDMGLPVTRVATTRKYWFPQAAKPLLPALRSRLLGNDSIERILLGPLPFVHLEARISREFELRHVSIRSMTDAELERLSIEGQLYLSLDEMRSVQAFYREHDREPTDIELETIAQTWSEHCSHKTLAGPIDYRDEQGQRSFRNMLKETIFAATQEIRQRLGSDDWCVSVFEDNAGVIRFDDQFHVAFKVETHNHPSALEPYGGANTGVGGVVRDILGTGRGAKPIANTDVFCFAPPDTPAADLPPGVLHPRRVMSGVVAGVRDYGNRMGIPTVNGAICFDPRYLGNPLVYCGCVGLIPADAVAKTIMPDDYIVVIGGRTGRDGIHGATFSSTELTTASESISGGAVQIGNAITEKMLADVLLQARDRGLFTAVTDCGAGGFSSAVGEMGAKWGAEVWLERAPLKYDGLTYTEIWISEAQERMVVAVPPRHWPELEQLCRGEHVEATVIGRFVDSGTLTLKYQDVVVGNLPMTFLHDGRPRIPRPATYLPAAEPTADRKPTLRQGETRDCLSEELGREATRLERLLLTLLGSLNIASKEWVIRQYDHEVQGGSVIKSLVGARGDGPSDAAVLRPILGSHRGIAISCGLNPRLGDLDTYAMAGTAIDEAIRNAVAVGADPRRIAILDNFCWGNTHRPETLGSLVRAALACHDVALAFGTPFISGKDSLNNEFSFRDDSGQTRNIAIPPTLLISALAILDDVRDCVTMDLKEIGNELILVGVTGAELGGSHVTQIDDSIGGEKATGNKVPHVDLRLAPRIYEAVHAAIQGGLVRACHDCSEGGLGVALSEMAFAGDLGVDVSLAEARLSSAAERTPTEDRAPGREGELDVDATVWLFSESNSRLICEVRPDDVDGFRRLMADLPLTRLGRVAPHDRFRVASPRNGREDRSPADAGLLVDLPVATLREAWKRPLRF